MNIRFGIGCIVFSVLCPAQAWGQESNDLSWLAPPREASFRNLEQRLIVRFGLGYDHVSSALSGENDLQGNTVSDDQLRTQTRQVRSQLALGVRGVGLPSLNVYTLSTALFDLDGQPTLGASENGAVRDGALHPAPHHTSGGAVLLVHSAYGELRLEDLGTEGALGRMYMRAGRQFHWGIAGVTFDGISVGHDDGTFRADAFFGRRSGVFNVRQDDPGLVGGLSAAFDFTEGYALPLLVRGEFMHFQRSVTLIPREQEALGQQEHDITLHLSEFGAYYDASDALFFSARASLLGAELSHIRGGARWAHGRMALIVDSDLKVGEDIHYDLAAGSASGNSRNAALETLRLNIPDLQNYLDGEARFAMEVGEWIAQPGLALEIAPSIGGRVVLADEADRSPYDADQLRWGLSSLGRFRLSRDAGVEVSGDYRGHFFARDEAVDSGTFTDTAAGAEVLAHEVAIGVRYNHGKRFIAARMLEQRDLSVGLSGFYRFYLLDNRFIESQGESLVGAGADGMWGFSDHVGAKVSYEYARDSNVFVRALDGFHNIHLSVFGDF